LRIKAMSDQDIEAAAANYRATYDTTLAELQSRVWGGNLHLGLFETPEEPLLAAQLRANRHMAAAADLRPGQVVIEAACGVGGTARFLAKEQGVRVRATNIAEMQLTEARELAEKAGLSHLLEFRFADYHNLPFVDASCDVWWCQEALLYSVDKRRVFDEAMRVVRPGGRLIMSDLLLDESVTGAAREQFTTKLKAPNMWSIERWDRRSASCRWRSSSARTGPPIPGSPSSACSPISRRRARNSCRGSGRRWSRRPMSGSRSSSRWRGRASSAGASMRYGAEA
jgi:Methylase involved in ubiquinone/menaquinone biosynthesis